MNSLTKLVGSTAKELNVEQNKGLAKLAGSKAKKQNVVNVFEEFLNEDDENVRFWAATFSLSSSPELAEKSLAKLTELSSITGLSAKTTLHLWKEGKLNLL